MPHANDLDLVRRVLAPERGAFDRLYERLMPRVLAYAQRRLGPSAAARAVTQASLEDLIEALPRYRGEVSLDAFMLRIVRQRAAHALATHSESRALVTEGGFPAAAVSLV